MKTTLFFIFIGLIHWNIAQNLKSFERDSVVDSKCVIILDGTLDYSASAMQNEILSPLIFGGEITNDIKDRQQQNHKVFNVLGLDARASLEVYVSKQFKNEKYNRFMPGFKYGQNYVGAALYATELYNLALYGNDMFLGQYCNISGTRFKYLQYQSFGFSVLDKETQSKFTLSAVGLNQFTQGQLYTTNFYYSEAGDSLYGIVQGELSTSKSPAYFKGIGVSADVDYRFPIVLNEEKSINMQFLISNLGFARAQDIQTQTMDTSFAFGGYTISQVINREGLLAPGFSFQDSLIEKEVTKKTIFLPAIIQFSNVVDIQSTQRIQATYGFRAIAIAGYVPYLYGGACVRLGKQMFLTNALCYGGFSGLKWNAAFQFSGPRFSMGLASENLLGLVSKIGFGKSLSIRLRCDI